MRQLFTIMLVIVAITIVVPVHSTFAFDEDSVAFVTKDDVVSTSSSTFEKIPDMTVDIKTKGPVIIQFCAASNNGGSGSMAVTVAVDGDNVPFGMELDGGIQFAVTPSYLPHCFTWVVTDLERDWHTIDVLWRKYGGGSAYMQSRTLVAYTSGGGVEDLASVGNETVFSRTSTKANRRAMPFIMPEDGTIKSISIYHEGGSGNMILAVYDGETLPDNRLAVTAQTPVQGSAGWQTIALSSPVFVPAGTRIWLGWVFENNPGIRYQSGSPGRAQSDQTWSGGMPDPFGASSQKDYVYSIFATYTPGGA